MGLTVYSLIIICFLASGVTSNCSIEGVTVWQLPISVGIEDYHEGVILQRAIQNIQGFNVAYYDDLNGGPYVSFSIENSMFVIQTNDAYRLYEENEMAQGLNFAVTFNCADGTNSLPLNFQIPINDNNNNNPLWKTESSTASPTTTYDFTIATPVAPGFQITDCVRHIIVRDVDLTNYAIDFGIEDNPYFEIGYDAASSTVDKEYKATLSTTTFLRSIPEPIVLRISATDIDETGDPPITTYTTVTIRGSPEFVLPDEPVFSQPLYTATYSENSEVTLAQTITLQQGYDSQVQFSLEGDYAADHFDIVDNGNQVSLVVTNPLPIASFRLGQIHLVVNAIRAYTSGASSAIIVELPEAQNLEFEQPHYEGEIVDNTLQLTQLILIQGYQDSTVTVTVEDYPSFFTATAAGNIITLSMTPLDASIIEANNFINLRVTASTDYSAATAIVTLEIIKDDIETPLFGRSLYTGTYDSTTGLTLEPLLLTQGYDNTVQVTFSGEHEDYFELVRNGASSTLRVIDGGLPSNIWSEQTLLLTIVATKPRTVGASAVVSIALPELENLEFEQAHYEGVIVDNTLQLTQLILSQGYQESTTLTVTVEDYSSFFTATTTGNIITLSMTPLDTSIIEANNFINLRVTASTEHSAVTAIVTLEIVKDDIETPVFGRSLYTGSYDTTTGLTLEPLLLTQGYDDTVQVTFSGEHEDYFELVRNGASSTLRVIDGGLPSNIWSEQTLLLTVVATKPRTVGASAVITIALPELENLEFEQAYYEGIIVDNTLQLTQLILSQGYQESTLTVTVEDYSSFFTATITGNIITLSMTPLDTSIIEANNFINLRVTASTEHSAATAIVTLEIVKDDIETPVFGRSLYSGSYDITTGLTLEPLLLTQGYDESVQVTLSGEHEDYFELVRNGASSTLRVIDGGLPSNIWSEQTLLLTIVATKPRTVGASAVVSIALPEELETETESFDKVLYEGTINLNVIQHEPITISGYTGSSVEILGDYRHLFAASLAEGTVIVVASGNLALPDDVSYVPLELRAGAASAVLLLNVLQSETPELPTVIFGSPSYVLRADMAQTGVIGRVSAAATNGESIAYALTVSDAHLQERVSITGEGEIYLSAPTNTGVYSFEVTATSVITQVRATASVQLTVEVTATCGDDDHALPPLIILDRDEEEPHENLVVLDSATQSGCTYSLTNRWPSEHDWLYVDENGLHARQIDREDPRIAFMALSQIQVELVLECPSDTQARVKRSLNTSPRHDWLGPYDYGSNKWILTDTILYNSRRSFVNLIVNDINDNYPIFVGYENQPVVVGYPIPELEDVVLPRALVELKATDADVGENAQLQFWSSEPVLAVAPSTGSVHVRDGATLTDEEVLTVSVTDLNGREDGLTTSIELMVKLIDTRHIAVVTVRNAFLDHEDTILSNLTAAVGYEVKVLSSAVISDDTDTSSANARNKRDLTSEGASLQLYVYGLIDREPVAVERLSTDISENVAAIDVTSTISLEDHLEGREIPVSAGRDTGLLVATIVLSVLLFILIVAIAVWFFLRWRKARNYEQFSDANSLASRNEPLEDPPKVESLKKPRLNLEELKRSERRLQEMLEAPIEDTTAKPSTSGAVDPSGALDTIINMAPPDTPMPIVIQSIDKLKDNVTSEDEDEFGERKNKSRRKSVVTFNENVEKIIHVEDIPDDNSSDVEIFKF